jgi:septation ring formation regulator EzrA
MLDDAKEHFERANEMLSKVKEGLEAQRKETSGFDALQEVGEQIESIEDQIESIEERLAEIEEESGDAMTDAA